MFGTKDYFTTDPDNIETIPSTRFEDYSPGVSSISKFTTYRRRDFWVGRPSLQTISGTDPALVRARPEANPPSLHMKPLFFEYTLNTTTKLLFGEPHSSIPKEKRDAVRENFDYAAFGCGIRARLADMAWLYNPTKYRNACEAVRDWATFFAGKAMKYKDEVGQEKAAEKYSFIIDLWKEMRDEDLVRDQLLNILVAGRDSTASLLSWTL